jgi:hypothetical protein
MNLSTYDIRMVNTLVLCRSDRADGGWSLHKAMATDADIASGDAPALASGSAEWKDGQWNRPNFQDYLTALAALEGPL